jgi:pimeloyl-ACP methyl ester carboxylesterase
MTRALLGVALAAALLTSGCIFRTVAEQQRRADANCRITGEVSAELAGEHPLIVGLVAFDSSAPEGGRLIDHFVLERPGHFGFVVPAGAYGLGAFQSLDGTLRYDPATDPGLPVDRAKPIQCGVGQAVSGIRLVIAKDSRLLTKGPIDFATIQVRSAGEQEVVSFGGLLARGTVTTLADPRFARENADAGLWRPLDFLVKTGAGLYFLEEYDPAKTPVLFVHGMVGTPRDFETLIAKLDRSRFQPWVFYYPSGANLDGVAGALSQLVTELRVQHRFPRLLVVAHSMGGLVSRAFLLRQKEDIEAGAIPVFVSMSTPWLGQPSAAKGVEHAPTVVRSWYAMAPNSEFQRNLFFEDPETMKVRRHLPEGIVHHLFFGYRRDEKWPGESSDSTIALVSQLRLEAQADATRLYGHDDTHVGILQDPVVSAQLNEILASAME